MSAPPERKSPGANRGSDLAWSAGNRELHTATSADTQTAVRQRRAAESVSFWKVSDFALPTRWAVQPFAERATRICFGRRSEAPVGDYLWLWYASGFVKPLGIVVPGVGASLAAQLADAIPGAMVADGRP